MPIQRTSSVPVKVRNAITLASRRTGASFDYLLNTAKRESSFKTQARSSSSSAAGLFQFVEGTWLKVVKEDGERLGLAKQARNIHRTSSGKYYVPNRGQRRKILALRHDAETSALVAAAYTEHNERYVRGRIGRTPSDGELYLAHFLGPGSAAKMIQLAESRPDSPANRYFPAAARANKSIFYKHGKPRSLAQVHKILISSHVDSQNGGVRQTRYGSFDFGIMGTLLEDTNGPASGSSRGHGGSIGVWGDIAGSKAGHADEGRGRGRKKTASSQAGDAQRHRHAAQQYRTAANTTGHTQSSDPKWIQDVFGGR